MGKRRREEIGPGDGSAQPRLRRRDTLSRTLMLASMEQDGRRHDYGVFVDFFSSKEDARLYRDGRQVAVADLPAEFDVPGGRIEVATSIFGLKRAHLVLDDGTETVLQPAKHSAEYWRARFGRRFPGWSRAIGALAIVILLVGLVVAVPQLLEIITSFDVVGERTGRFVSPISLPAWLNTTLFVAGLAAATERALTLRSHWLVDADTWVLGT